MSYIAIQDNKVTFDLSDLSNREQLTGTYAYERTLTFEVTASYDIDPDNESLPHTFSVKEYDCRPQTSPTLMTVNANFDPRYNVKEYT